MVDKCEQYRKGRESHYAHIRIYIYISVGSICCTWHVPYVRNEFMPFEVYSGPTYQPLQSGFVRPPGGLEIRYVKATI